MYIQIYRHKLIYAHMTYIYIGVEDDSGCKSVKNTWRSVEHARRPLPLFENILDMDFIEDSEGRVEGELDDEGVFLYLCINITCIIYRCMYGGLYGGL
jgi:hypothetical protein